MAVSFKVPASPKRDIFVIDNFLGVDLTNTGSNIDENRSPNAENMVRLVPGKVRKRTGYQTKIEISDRKDVNRAKNTSNEWKEVEVSGTSYATADVLYELYENVESPCVYFEVETSGEYTVAIERENSGIITWNCTDYSGAHWSYNSMTGEKATKFFVYKLSTNPTDYFKIRNMRIVSYNSTKATTVSEWKALEWESAPEDIGIIFKRDTTNPTIWGFHKLRNGVFEGNRVINVNRALGTSDVFVSYSVPARGSSVTLYELGNPIYANDTKRTDLYVEFDYISDGDAIVWIAAWGFTNDTWIKNTGGQVAHFSGKIGAGSSWAYTVTLEGKTSAVNVQIKNFSVMYEKDDTYTWNPAPEDEGKEFNIGDVFNVRSKNYAIIDEYSISSMGRHHITITDSTLPTGSYYKVSFKLYFSTVNPSASISVEPSYFDGSTYRTNLNWSRRFAGNVNTVEVELYAAFSSPGYVNSLDVSVGDSSGSFSLNISEIKVQEIVGKDNYDISSKNYIYHAGSKFYLRASNSNELVEIYSSANQHLSKSWQLDDKLFILDGTNIYQYSIGNEGVEVINVEGGYIPLVTISKQPSGGGTSYEPLNMLQAGFYEQFIVESADATTKQFYLSFKNLDATLTKAWVLDSNGNWIEKKEGTDYTVNRALGLFQFITAPGVTPLTGEDNVKILAYRTIPGYSDRIAKCTVGALFGVGGASDRLFLSGNPDYPNWDFYSEQYDPTYFPDTGYSSLGSAASAIVGYAIVNNYLATFKDDFDSSQAVFIREGDLIVDDNNVSQPAFRLINTLQGNGVVAPYSFGYLQTEPLFLTRSGIYAITAQDITGEKYSQNRSFYLDGFLTKETNLETAVATVFDDQYILALNNKLYILDGLQATRTDRSEPYATRQYVGFYCTNIPAVSMWTDEQALWIGTSDGKICRFATDIEDLNSYNDDGKAIYCCWETPDLDGKLFYKNKTFRYFAIRMMQALRTSVQIWSRKLGTWSFIKEDTASGITFDFANIDFSNFSFSTDISEKVAHTKIRIKKVDKARFRVENGKLNEPFGLFDLALEYIESGNYKG